MKLAILLSLFTCVTAWTAALDHAIYYCSELIASHSILITNTLVKVSDGTYSLKAQGSDVYLCATLTSVLSGSWFLSASTVTSTMNDAKALVSTAAVQCYCTNSTGGYVYDFAFARHTGLFAVVASGNAVVNSTAIGPAVFFFGGSNQSSFSFNAPKELISDCAWVDSGENNLDVLMLGMPYISPMILTGRIVCIYQPLPDFGTCVTFFNGTNGCVISGIGPEGFGQKLLELGDVNGDTRDDMLITGERTYILLGRTNKFAFAQASATEVFNGTDGWSIGFSSKNSSALGDFNGDGLADWACATTIVFGARTSLHGMTNIAEGTGVTFSYLPDHAQPPYEYFGNSMAGVGDVNADGYADFAVACHLWNDKWYNYPQNCFVIYGRPLWPASMPLSTSWFDAVRGFIVQDPPSTGTPHEYWGPSSYIGNPLGGKGDFNGDGYDDPLIGASGANELYVFFGGESPAWPPALLNPMRLMDSGTGVWQYTSDTNTLVVGMKATNAAMYAWLNGLRAPQWDAGYGTRCFTNTLGFGTNETLMLRYACSNALGWSRHATLLTIAPVPEPAAVLLMTLACMLWRTTWLRSTA